MHRSLLAAPIAALLFGGLTGIASAEAEDQTALEAQVCAALDLGGLPSVNAIIGVTAYENIGSLSGLTRATDYGTELLETTTEPQVREAAGCDRATTEPPAPNETDEPTTEPEPSTEAPNPTEEQSPTDRPDAPLYADCAEAREFGAAPIAVGDPGYRAELDSDSDGTACESEDPDSLGNTPTGDDTLGGTDDSNSGVVDSIPSGSVDTGYVAAA